MKFRLIPAILIGLALSITTSEIVYFGYTPNYYFATRVSRNAFHYQFDHDVFKYRILSKYLLLLTDKSLQNIIPEKTKSNAFLSYIQNGSERFYYAYFYLNTFFLCLTSIIIILLLRLKKYLILTDTEKWYSLFLSIIVINLSQFALYYYDISSYFFQLAILYIFLRYEKEDYVLTLTAICALIILSTLNRESSALSASLISTFLVKKGDLSLQTLFGMLLLVLAFLAPYIFLQYTINDPLNLHFYYHDAGHLKYKINIVGISFWVLFLCLPIVTANSKDNKSAILLFHLLSMPYIIYCFKYGVLWEIRLYIPLFVSSLFISRINFPCLKSEPVRQVPLRQ